MWLTDFLDQVLHLMSIYNGMSGKESNLEQSYVLLDLAGQVALRVCRLSRYFLSLSHDVLTPCSR